MAGGCELDLVHLQFADAVTLPIVLNLTLIWQVTYLTLRLQ